nr:hypothetical protein [Elizabethkingia sp. ASV34]
MYSDSATEWYKIGFHLETDYLNLIISTDKDKGNRIELLHIDYKNIDGLNYISYLGFPFGKQVKIGYDEQAFTYKDIEIDMDRNLPGVRRLEITGVKHQENRVTTYTYTRGNFLGGGGARVSPITASISHTELRRKKRSTDIMYVAKLTSAYTYASTETIIKKEKKEGGKEEEIVIVTTIRTYNNFHLLISEETMHHAHSVKTEIEYYLLPEKLIEDQPKNFSYCRKKTVSYKKKEKDPDTGKETEKERKEVTLTEYNDHGELVSIIYPNGNKEVFSWITPTPEFIHAADKDKKIGNIVRFLETKESFVVDRSGKAKEQKLIKDSSQQFFYKQIAIKPIKLGEIYMLPIFVCDSIVTFRDEMELNYIYFTYESDLDNEYFGKIDVIVASLHNTTGGQDEFFETKTSFGYTIEKLSLITTTTVVNTFDGIPLKTVKEISVFTGALLKEMNTAGITTEYTYDYLGRIKEQVYAEKPYKSTKTWTYEVQGDRLAKLPKEMV